MCFANTFIPSVTHTIGEATCTLHFITVVMQVNIYRVIINITAACVIKTMSRIRATVCGEVNMLFVSVYLGT